MDMLNRAAATGATVCFRRTLRGFVRTGEQGGRNFIQVAKVTFEIG